MAFHRINGTVPIALTARGAGRRVHSASSTASLYVFASGHARTPTEDIRNPQLKLQPNEAKMVLR